MDDLGLTPRLRGVYDAWRAQTDYGESLLPSLVHDFSRNFSNLMGYVFFGHVCPKVGAELKFVGTEAADHLRIDSRHGLTAIPILNKTVTDLINEIQLEKGPALLPCEGLTHRLILLFLPTGKSPEGHGFLGVLETSPGKKTHVKDQRAVQLRYLHAGQTLELS